MLELASPLLTNFLGGFALNQNTCLLRQEAEYLNHKKHVAFGFTL